MNADVLNKHTFIHINLYTHLVLETITAAQQSQPNNGQLLDMEQQTPQGKLCVRACVHACMCMCMCMHAHARITLDAVKALVATASKTFQSVLDTVFLMP